MKISVKKLRKMIKSLYQEAQKQKEKYKINNEFLVGYVSALAVVLLSIDVLKFEEEVKKSKWLK